MKEKKSVTVTFTKWSWNKLGFFSENISSVLMREKGLLCGWDSCEFLTQSYDQALDINKSRDFYWVKKVCWET